MSNLIKPIAPSASLDLSEETAKNDPYVLAAGISKALAFIGINMDVTHRVLEEPEDNSDSSRKYPRWAFDFELKDYKD